MVVMVVVPAATAGVAVAAQEANLDVLLVNQGPHAVLELPGQGQAALWPALDDGQAQVAELVFALHVVLGLQARVLFNIAATQAAAHIVSNKQAQLG